MADPLVPVGAAAKFYRQREDDVYVNGDYPYPGRWFPRDDPNLRTWKCGHARRVDAGRGFWHDCPACAASKRHARKYIAGHVALLLIQIGLMLLMAGGVRP